MKNEAEFKSAFKKSVRAQGGFSISLAAPMLSGIPDLYVIMPGFMPVLLEAKWLGEVGERFSKKIKYTKMQKLYLEECNKIKPLSALGLIGFKQSGLLLSTLCSTDSISSHGDGSFHLFIKKLVNVQHMFVAFGVPKLNGIYVQK